ncbi:hypothetical protein ACFQ38_08315 [Sporosarcina contaminans]|uniref:Uncharacterized protein n=1 Tax=Sporosarcina contaminans TaxID=633403 RepID=A0ABW3TXE8_9BACL
MKDVFSKQSIIGYTIKILGIVIIGWGVLQAFFFFITGFQSQGHVMHEWGELQYIDMYNGISFLGAVGIIATHLITGVLVIGFGEVIDLLQKIYFRLHPESEKKWKEEQAKKRWEKEQNNNNDLPFWAEQDIKNFYEEQKAEIHSIKLTTHPYIFKIAVDDRVEYVEVGGLKTRVLSEEEAKEFE